MEHARDLNVERIQRDLGALNGTISDQHLAELVEQWTAASVTAEAVEPVLRYFESHPDVDVGMPGPLVHFVEQFQGRGYEQRLLESLGRRPVLYTIWMLNRLINGTPPGVTRQDYVRAMSDVRNHPKADRQAQSQAEHFLARLS